MIDLNIQSKSEVELRELIQECDSVLEGIKNNLKELESLVPNSPEGEVRENYKSLIQQNKELQVKTEALKESCFQQLGMQ